MDDQGQSAALKGCPFNCQSVPYVRDSGHHTYWIRCDRCGADGPTKPSALAARIAWNTRSPFPGDREEVARMKKFCAGEYLVDLYPLNVAALDGLRADIEAILALSASPIQGGGWRPIEEAPRDGIECIVNDPDGEYEWASASWADDTVAGERRVGWWLDGFWMDPQPTLYLPILAPPVPSEETK